MSRKTICVVATLLCCVVSAAQPRTEIRNCLNEYMRRFPESTLQDVYKLCFQDYFGPEHLLSDTAAAAAYMRSELSMPQYNSDYYTPTCCNGNYYRVNLILVRDSIVPFDVLFGALVSSCQRNENASVEQWKSVWDSIIAEAAIITPKPQNFSNDSASIAEMLQNGKYVMHHSRHFNATYNIHYRLVRRDIFEKVILPLIRNQKKKD